MTDTWDQITGWTLVAASGQLHKVTLAFHAGQITSVVNWPGVSPVSSYHDIPAGDLLLLPGFIDVHNHGGAGESFPTSDLEGCRKAARHHRAHGSTTLFASLVSENEENLTKQVKVLAELCDEDELDGIHLEGPCISELHCGAQNPERVCPIDLAMLERVCTAAAGWVKAITFAPELAKSAALIRFCADNGIVASFGHTHATFAETAMALTEAQVAGATVTATHLFNAMPPLHHRNPGAVAALLQASRTPGSQVACELVADGVHLDDATVDLAIAAGTCFFVTDAMGAAGMADGQYQLGALAVTVADGVARLTTTDGSAGAIAGGTSRLVEQVQRFLRRGKPLAAVIKLATTNAATVLGQPDLASLSSGPANLVALDRQLRLRQVIRKGQLLAHYPESD